MMHRPTINADHLSELPVMPPWLLAKGSEAPEDLAFYAGAALAHLDLVLRREEVPQALLRERLALRVSEIGVTYTGRPERAADLRDALSFLQPGAHPGPAGEVYLSWQRAVARPISVKSLARALPSIEPTVLAVWLDTGKGAPVARATAVIEAVLATRPNDVAAASLMTDAVLAQALGWNHVLPFLALGLKRVDLRKTGEDLQASCAKAIVTAATEVTREATDLTRRAARLIAVAPKLRAKGSEEAVALFLTRDAVAPTALTSLRSGRSARRFCDRLVELGVVRELTGRDMFRLYGV